MREHAPLAIDLFCGLGGWTEGLLAEGFDVIGFDVEQHVYGEHRYPAQLVLQDVLTLHGAQFKDVALIVASPPCQEYSYMAMPWTRAKQIARALRGDGEFPEGYTGSRTVPRLTALFDACFRIQREACVASGRFIPLVVENVCGAQKWVGRAAWHYGSYYLWGDVPALMPMPHRARKVAGFRFDGNGGSFQTASVNDGVKIGDRNKGRTSGSHTWTTQWDADGVKVGGLNWSDRTRKGQAFNTHAETAIKIGGGWFHDSTEHSLRRHSSKSTARKAASARIAKIPEALARHIAHVYYPREDAA